MKTLFELTVQLTDQEFEEFKRRGLATGSEITVTKTELAGIIGRALRTAAKFWGVLT